MRLRRLLTSISIPLLLLTAPAYAASITFKVDTTQDAADATVGDGTCLSTSGCSLRAALQEVNAAPGNTYDITLPPGTYSLTDAGMGEDLAETGDLDINSPNSAVTIEADSTVGGNASNVIIEAGSGFADRLFQVVNASSVTLKNLTLRNAYTAQNGGAIYNSSATGTSLDLTDDTLSGNTVDFSIVSGGSPDPSTGGGALYSSSTGALSISGCTFSGNKSLTAYGGAAYIAAGTLTIDHSTFDGNQTFFPSDGGALYTLYSVSNTVITNTTFSNNNSHSGHGGAALFDAQQPSVFSVNPPVTISDSTFTGNQGGPGGALENDSNNMTLNNVTVTGNTGMFGALYNPKYLTVNSSTFSNNSSSSGGAISNSGHATIIGSTFSGNAATLSTGGAGGAINSTGLLIPRNSTITDNQATGSGGGIYFSGPSTNVINNVTITKNTADSTSANLGTGGGLYADSLTTSLVIDVSNTILSDNIDNNTTPAPDCYDQGQTLATPATLVVSIGYNLVQTPANCGFAAATNDLTGSSAGLAPLGLYGGSNETQALTSGSPAIDAGNPATPTGSGGTCETTDQRGQTRPAGTACDIGAFEYYGTTDLGVTITQNASTVTVGNDIVYTITITNTGGADAHNVTVQQKLPDPTLTAFASANSTTFNCPTPGNGMLTCTVASLAAGASSTITVHVTANAAGNVTSSVAVSMAETDSNLADNSGTISTTLSSSGGGGGGITVAPGGGGAFGLLSLVGLLALAAIGRKVALEHRARR